MTLSSTPEVLSAGTAAAVDVPDPRKSSVLFRENGTNQDTDMTDTEGPTRSSGRPDPAEQARIIDQYEEGVQVQDGDTMYLVSCRWYDAWRQYTSQPSSQQGPDNMNNSNSSAAAAVPSPGPIDNSSLLSAGPKLKEHLNEGRDYVVLSSSSWNVLKDWYGSGTEIGRTAVMEGVAPHSKRPRVVVYPIQLDVWHSDKEVKPMQADQSWTVAQLKAAACALYGLAEGDVELWDYYRNEKYGSLEDKLDSRVAGATIMDKQAILLDLKSNPLPAKQTTPTGGSSPLPLVLGWEPATTISTTPPAGLGTRSRGFQEDSVVMGGDPTPGLFGLQNLGNTCFMNSSLQCLMHTVPLLKVFLSHAYEADVNTVNPLGMKGELAQGFGGLMGMAWQGGVRMAVPRAFKATIARFAPQFSGYQQHDSQEFLAFLLDGLHEDLNRVKDKPYIEEAGTEGRPDAELAVEAWTNYRARNDSAIVDHFQGLYKSTLVCPQCAYSSIKFDPFMYLSLPLPESRVRRLVVLLLAMDGSRLPVQYGVEVPQTGTLQDLYVALCRAAGLHLQHPDQQLVAARMALNKWSWDTNTEFEAFPNPKTRLAEVEGKNSLLMVYMYGSPAEGPAGPGNQQVVVRMRKVTHSPRRSVAWAAPLLLYCPLSDTYDPMCDVMDPGAGPGEGGGSSSSSRLPYRGPWEVSLGAAVWGQVRRALAPFRTGLPVWDEAAAQAAAATAADTAAAAAAGVGGGQSGGQEGAHAVPTNHHAQQQQQQPEGEAAAAMDTQSPACSSMPAAPMSIPRHTPGALGDSEECDMGVPAVGCGSRRSSDGSLGGHWGSECGSAGPAAGEDLDLDMDAIPDLEDGAADMATTAPSSPGEEGCSFPGLPCTPEGPGAPDMQQQEATAAAAPVAGPAAPGEQSSHVAEPQQQPQQQEAVPVAVFDMWSGQAHTAAAEEGTAAAPKPADASAAAGLAALARQQQAAAGRGSSSSRAQGQTHTQGVTRSVMRPYALYLADERGAMEWTFLDKNTRHPHTHHTSFTLEWYHEEAQEVSFVSEGLAATRAAIVAGHQHTLGAHPPQAPQQQQQQPAGAAGTGAAAASSARGGQPAAVAVVGDGHVAAAAAAAAGVSAEGHAAAAGDGLLHVPAPGAPWCLSDLGGYATQLLEAPLKHTSAAAVEELRDGPPQPVSLGQCVEAFLQPEQLSSDDEWYCPKCKEFVQADKKLDLWSLPEVLVIHLKRFRYTRYSRDKLDTPVAFPLTGLDLGPCLLPHQQQQQAAAAAVGAGAPQATTSSSVEAQPTAGGASSPSPSSSGSPSSSMVYDCYAVSNHFGGLGGGHYTAFAQLPGAGQWYRFDDSHVGTASADEVQSSAAYVLFYRRRQEASHDPPALVEQLLDQHRQHEAAAGAAAAAAAAAAQAAAATAAAAPAAMDGQLPAAEAAAAATAGDQGASSCAGALGGGDVSPAAANSDQTARPGQPPAPCGTLGEQQAALNGHVMAAGTRGAPGGGTRGVPAAGLGDEEEEGGTGMSALIGSLPSAEGSAAEAGREPLQAAGADAEADNGAASSSRSTHGRGAAPADSSSSGGSSKLDRMQ